MKNSYAVIYDAKLNLLNSVLKRNKPITRYNTVNLLLTEPHLIRASDHVVDNPIESIRHGVGSGNKQVGQDLLQS